MYENTFDQLFSAAFGGSSNTWKWDNSSSTLYVALPGVKRDELTLEVVDGKLKLEINSKSRFFKAKDTYAFALRGLPTDPTARLEDGVLEVKFTKVPDANRKIQIG